MQTHDHIDSPRLARGDEGVGAEGAVGDEDVARTQMTLALFPIICFTAALLILPLRISQWKKAEAMAAVAGVAAGEERLLNVVTRYGSVAVAGTG